MSCVHYSGRTVTGWSSLSPTVSSHHSFSSFFVICNDGLGSSLQICITDYWRTAISSPGVSHLVSDDGDFFKSAFTDSGFKVLGDCDWLVGTVASKPETLRNGKISTIIIAKYVSCSTYNTILGSVK